MNLLSPYKAWYISSDSYPANGSVQQQLTFLLKYAVLAPSTFNAQPWACSIDKQGINVYLDKKRLPQKSDKTGRFGYISLGSFIANLEVAAGHFGWQVVTSYKLQDRDKRYQQVAQLELSKKAQLNDANEILFLAIPERATNRSPRTDRPLPDNLVSEVKKLLLPDIDIQSLGQHSQAELIKLSEAADLAIWSDLEFRQEHVDWVRANWTVKRDGMPGFGVGIKNIPSLMARPMILSDKFAAMQAKKNQMAIKQSQNFIIFTSMDDALGWLSVGRSYEKIALFLQSKGLTMAPMGQFIEHDQTRANLQLLLKSVQPPQFFCRVGYPSQPVRHSPRRPAGSILLKA